VQDLGSDLLSCCVFTGKIMHQSSDELIMFFQCDLMLDFGFDDDYVIQSLVISMQELHRMKLDVPPLPRPGDAVEKPMKPFGCFEPPSVEQLIASMQVETANGEFVGRPIIPPDGGPVIVPDVLLKRQASDWSFLARENDEVSSTHESAAATDCPSSRTSLVSSLLDNIGSFSANETSEPGIVSFVAADHAVCSRTTLTDRSPDSDQISNSEYDNVPVSGNDEFFYEQELEQTLESIEQEIQELLGMHADNDEYHETVSSAVSHSDHLYSRPSVTPLSVTDAQQQNHVDDSYACRSPQTESSVQSDDVFTRSSLTSELHSNVAHRAAVPSPSTAIAGVTSSAPVVSWSDRNSYQPRLKDDDLVVIPIQHLPSAAPYRPPVMPKPKNVAMPPSIESQSSPSVLTPIPVLHLRTVPIAQFTGISSLSATKRPVPTSSANGC